MIIFFRIVQIRKYDLREGLKKKMLSGNATERQFPIALESKRIAQHVYHCTCLPHFAINQIYGFDDKKWAWCIFFSSIVLLYTSSICPILFNDLNMTWT